MKKEFETLIKLSGRMDPSLQKAMKMAQSESARTANAMANMQNKTNAMALKTNKSMRLMQTETLAHSAALERLSGGADKVFNKIGRAALYGGTVAGVGLVALSQKGLQLASDLNEVQNVVDTTFRNNAEQINTWSKAALKAYGLAELQAKQYNGTMGAMLKSSGLSGQAMTSMSKNLAGLAGDFASFYNLKPDEAFDKIRAGISGETEPLQQLGIKMSVANLQAYALSKGIKKSYASMDQASQTLLRYSYLMSVSRDAQGDFAKTQDSAANQQRLFEASYNQLIATLVQKGLPVLTKVLTQANKWIDSLASNPQKIDQLQTAFYNLADGIYKFGTDAIPKIKEFSDFVIQNWPMVKGLIEDIGFAFVTWKAVKTVSEAVQIGKDMADVYALVSIKLGAASTAYGTYAGWKSKDVLETLYLQGLYAKDAIALGLKTAGMWALSAATTVWSGVTVAATAVGSAFGAVLAFITSPIGLVILGVAALIAVGVLLYKNWDKVSTFMVAVWQNNVMPFFSGIGAWFGGIWSGVTFTFTGAWIGIYNWFVGLVGGIKNVFAGVGDFFGSILGGVSNMFKGYINTYIKIANFLIGGLNKIQFTAPDWVPGIGGKALGVNIPQIPMFARGGFTNRPSIFGEAGPEAAIPIRYKSPRSISLLNRTAKMIGADSQAKSGAVGLHFNFNFYGSVNSKEDVKQGVRESEDYIRSIVEEYLGDEGRPSFA